MAKKPSLGYGLSRAATIAGWCYLPFYLFLLSYLIQYVAALLGLHPSMLTVNLIYFAVNLAVVLIISRFPAAAVLRAGLLEFCAGHHSRLRALLRRDVGRALRAGQARAGVYHL